METLVTETRETAYPTLLIANRGEIAVRIMRTAKAEGYRTIAIYSDADRDALHVHSADCAVAIGGNTPAESYLDIDKIIAAANRTGATAVHPGYGFLAENAEFARACYDAGLQFVGPAADTLELMGNKRRAKEFAAGAGVPCIPGFRGSRNGDEFIRAADEIGYPVMLKAAAGGGGRGMRLVQSPQDLLPALRSARSEAQSAFGCDEIILEKALIDARHIEIQVFADGHGNAIHLGERDCSIQRRHQKILEESPSPAVDCALREKMGSAAVAVTKACNYLGAGTVEFLLDSSGAFYFLEMNTRLQVEHPVTELVTGFDLVAWQLAVARGEALPVTQGEVAQCGHAMEVRLYAEDPRRGFLPQSGSILHWREAPVGNENPGIRIDCGLRSGTVISPFYDPMLGKLVAHGRNREECRRRLYRALCELELVGPKNNIAFLQRLLLEPVFIDGNATTTFLDSDSGTVLVAALAQQPEPLTVAIAAALTHERQLDDRDRRSGRANWRSGDNSLPLYYRLAAEGRDFECDLYCLGGHSYRISPSLHLPDQRDSGDRCEYEIEVRQFSGADAQLLVNGVSRSQFYLFHEKSLHLLDAGQQWQFQDTTWLPAKSAEGTGTGEITAPMNGCLLAIYVQPDQVVCRGDALAVVEAMKMEHTLMADCDGTVTSLAASTGQQVSGGQLLLRIEPAEVRC